ncbi:MAG TPA: TlpA disulfide reductase family protein [Solirubrobacteraceae bacterium]|jgi:uncharacterized membrane protein YphA (DoxX/SURF4 family)|nr:TlpA disulfide reductase family protein [Solirubrobacteraceae bacterium]
MSTILIVARFTLAAVFVVAALAKFADLSGSRHALEGFAVPARLVRVGAVALPAGELLAGILAIFATTAQLGAGLAALLLLAFLTGMVRALRAGRTPDCHCFGQLHSQPVGVETIARNVVLLCVAVFVAAAGPGPSVPGWVDDHDAAHLALVATAMLAVVLAYSCVALWRENRRLTGHGPAAPEPVAPLRIGEPAPGASLVDLAGAAISSGDLLDGQRTVLVFISSSCGPCAALLPELARWKGMLTGRLGIHVVAAGSEPDIRRLADEHHFPMLLDLDGTAGRAFNVPATPSGIEVDADGAISSVPASGGPAIEALIRSALKRTSSSFALDVRHVRTATGIPVTD